MNESLVRNNLRTLDGKAAIWSDEHGLSWVSFEPGVEITGEDAARLLELAKITATDEEYFRVIFDLRTSPVITDEARKFAASGGPGTYVSSFAILVSDLPMRLVGNFFIRFHKPKQPTQIFSDAAEAVRWSLAQYHKK
jgi:hypothetical protein